jgi:CBS-domain-containing membrane protein
MSCSEAMIEEVITGRPDMTVEAGLELFSKHGIRSMPVVDERHNVIGIFNFHHLLEEILPVAVTFDDHKMDLNLGYLSGEAPWVAHRLKLLLPKKLEEAMMADFKTVNPETPLREGVRLLVKQRFIVPVVNKESGKLVGIVSSQSAVKALMKIKEELDYEVSN